MGVGEMTRYSGNASPQNGHCPLAAAHKPHQQPVSCLWLAFTLTHKMRKQEIETVILVQSVSQNIRLSPCNYGIEKFLFFITSIQNHSPLKANFTLYFIYIQCARHREQRASNGETNCLMLRKYGCLL